MIGEWNPKGIGALKVNKKVAAAAAAVVVVMVVRRRPFMGFQIQKDQLPFRRHRQKSWAIGNSPLCTHMCPYPFFEATPPGAAPGPPVKTGARVRRFRGYNK